MASLVLHGCVARPEPGRAGENAGRPRVEDAASWPSRNIAADVVSHAGRSAVRVVGTAGDDVVDKLVVLPFRLGNRTIESYMSGVPEPCQPPDARAYFGVAFRGDELSSLRFEALYVRPVTLRSARPGPAQSLDPIYHLFPDRPWDRLRRDAPGRYESYVDLRARRMDARSGGAPGKRSATLCQRRRRAGAGRHGSCLGRRDARACRALDRQSDNRLFHGNSRNSGSAVRSGSTQPSRASREQQLRRRRQRPVAPPLRRQQQRIDPLRQLPPLAPRQRARARRG